MPRVAHGRSLATPIIALATLAVSVSAIFIRIAQDDAGTIVFLRMGMAATLLAPWAWHDLHRTSHDRRRVGVIILSGLLLSGHFLLWTASLGLTSIASSVLLVSMHPLIVAPLGRRFLGDPITSGMLLGILVAVAGTIVAGAGDLRLGGRALAGDGLALGGAVCLAGYLLIGRGVRNSTSVAGYSAMVFAAVSAIALVLTSASGSVHLPSARTFLVCLALAVVCTLGGHTAFNWALQHVSAVTVSISFLGEPPLTTLLGVIVLGSTPSATTIVGGLLILTGLTVTLRAEGRAQIPAALELE